MNCIIIDHQETASKKLAAFIAATPGFELLAICKTLQSANELLNEQKIDVVFLEPDLPGIKNLSAIKWLQEKSAVIIVSQSSSFALDAFELGVTDYLVKPFSLSRFQTAIQKLKQPAAKEQLSPAKNNSAYFFVKSDNRFEKIDLNGILYIEGLQNYITIQTETKKVITYSSLKSIESYLSEKEFLRVQKSFIISIAKIDRIESDDVVIGKTVIPISRAIKDSVMKTILNDRLYKYQC